MVASVGKLGDFSVDVPNSKLYLLDNAANEIYRLNLNNIGAAKMKVYTGLRSPKSLAAHDKLA